MKEVKIYEEDIQEAYKEGCEEAQETLKQLYPGLKLGEEKEKFYSPIELTAKVLGHSRDSLYLSIRSSDGKILISGTHCKDEDNYIWIPFLKSDGISLGKNGTNFRISKRL